VTPGVCLLAACGHKIRRTDREVCQQWPLATGSHPALAAECLANGNRSGVFPQPVKSDRLLAEWDYGQYEGRTSADIRQARPGWSVFRDGCPGGEAVEEVALRADRLITRLAGLSGNVALFSSGQFGCSLAARWIGSKVIEGQHLMLGTASISVLGHNPTHPELRVIAHWNLLPDLQLARCTDG
jgi:broad specificity phosphatase PhoE